MTGRMKRYEESLRNAPEPVLLSQISIKLDLRGLMKYAKSKGLRVAQLSEKEKLDFIKG